MIYFKSTGLAGAISIMRVSSILFITGGIITTATMYMAVHPTAKAHPIITQKDSRAPELTPVSSTVFADDTPSSAISMPLPAQATGAPIITVNRSLKNSNSIMKLDLPGAPAPSLNQLGDHIAPSQKPLLDFKFSPPADVFEAK